MGVTGNTEIGITKQEVIAAAVQRELKQNAILFSTVTDVSQFATKGTKSISYPKLSSFVVENRVSGVQGTKQSLTASLDKLDLNVNAYVSWLIDSSDAFQSSINGTLEFAVRAAAAHGRFVDEKIIEAVKQSFGFVATSVTLRDKILEVRAWLKRNQAVLENSYVLAAPEMEADLLKVDEFSKADIYGQAVIPTGVIGRIYGMPVFTHSGLLADELYIYEKTGVAVGFQSAPNYASQPSIEYGTTAMLEAMDQLFGVEALQIGQGVATIAGKSPLIAKVTGA